MTNAEDHLRAAQDAVGKAKRLEDQGEGRAAEDYWNEAERRYESAGVDPDHFERQPAPAPNMDLYWVFPTDCLEFTMDSETDDITGIVADASVVENLEP